VFSTAFTKKLVNLKRKVKIQGQLIEAFGIGRGLRQCDALCTTLLIIVLEKVIRAIKTDRMEQFLKE
jgi:hypothetical protein